MLKENNINDKEEEEERYNEQKLLSQNLNINFLIKCVNPMLVHGILEAIKNMPEDPIDFLVSH